MRLRPGQVARRVKPGEAFIGELFQERFPALLTQYVGEVGYFDGAERPKSCLQRGEDVAFQSLTEIRRDERMRLHRKYDPPHIRLLRFGVELRKSRRGC